MQSSEFERSSLGAHNSMPAFLNAAHKVFSIDLYRTLHAPWQLHVTFALPEQALRIRCSTFYQLQSDIH